MLDIIITIGMISTALLAFIQLITKSIQYSGKFRKLLSENKFKDSLRYFKKIIYKMPYKQILMLIYLYIYFS